MGRSQTDYKTAQTQNSGNHKVNIMRVSQSRVLVKIFKSKKQEAKEHCTIRTFIIWTLNPSNTGSQLTNCMLNV
jgi:hypothetical protein